MLYRYFVFLISFFCSISLTSGQISKPFPQHISYFGGAIKPNHIPQTRLDNTVRDFYTQWKNRFIKTVPGKPQSYVWFEGKGNKQCVSEGQGYGMVIVALMAGYDPSAKAVYDNLFRYYRAHPSEKSKYLMAWAQKNNGSDLDKTSASDGDMDIAYSLLLAARQWGNNGAINYLQEGRAMITAVMQYEINHKSWSVLLSDGEEEESADYFAMRSSDFMPAHFKVFQQVTGDNRWGRVIDAGYRLVAYMQYNYSPDAGLLPDFIVGINKKPKPAGPNFLEDRYDGQYNYNACRVPWRIATDYLLTGDKRSKAITAKINKWIRKLCSTRRYRDYFPAVRARATRGASFLRLSTG